MMLIRAAVESDLNALYRLAQLPSSGLTSLPPEPERLKQKIQQSITSFHKQVLKPDDEEYLFVLEDCTSGEIIGCSGLVAQVGRRAPFYTYRVTDLVQQNQTLGIQKSHKLLFLVNDLHGCSELVSLFLRRDQRRQALGKLLSLSRFLFMAHWPERFAETVIAELRGISDSNGCSPFWEYVGAHFFGIGFPQADYLSGLGDSFFISDLMPKYPIYLDLLPKQAQSVVGKPHQGTVPAFNLLQEQGFRFTQYVDVFDAGPTLIARRELIKGIKDNQLTTVKEIKEINEQAHYLVGTCNLNFRAAIAAVEFAEQGINLSKEVALGLQIEPGDKVRILKLS